MEVNNILVKGFKKDSIWNVVPVFIGFQGLNQIEII